MSKVYMPLPESAKDFLHAHYNGTAGESLRDFEALHYSQPDSMNILRLLPSARYMVEEVVQFRTGRQMCFRFVFHRDDIQFLSSGIHRSRTEQVYFYLEQGSGEKRTYIGETQKEIHKRYKGYKADKFPKNAEPEWCMVGTVHATGDQYDRLNHEERQFIESTLNEIISSEPFEEYGFSALANCKLSHKIHQISDYTRNRQELTEVAVTFLARMLSISHLPTEELIDLLGYYIKVEPVYGFEDETYGDYLTDYEQIFENAPILFDYDMEYGQHDIRALYFSKTRQAFLLFAYGVPAEVTERFKDDDSLKIARFVRNSFWWSRFGHYQLADGRLFLRDGFEPASRSAMLSAVWGTKKLASDWSVLSV